MIFIEINLLAYSHGSRICTLDSFIMRSLFDIDSCMFHACRDSRAVDLNSNDLTLNACSYGCIRPQDLLTYGERIFFISVRLGHLMGGDDSRSYSCL